MPIVLLPITQCLCGSQPRPTVSTRVINLSVLIKGTVVAPEFIRLEQKRMKERTKERGKKILQDFSITKLNSQRHFLRPLLRVCHLQSERCVRIFLFS